MNDNISILEDFYQGKIQPNRDLNVFDPDFKPITNKISDGVHWLKNRLTEDEYERFEKLETAYSEYASLSQMKGFLYGFKLGSLILLETLTSGNDLSKGDE